LAGNAPKRLQANIYYQLGDYQLAQDLLKSLLNTTTMSEDSQEQDAEEDYLLAGEVAFRLHDWDHLAEIVGSGLQRVDRTSTAWQTLNDWHMAALRTGALHE
jgi:hypothetical protein